MRLVFAAFLFGLLAPVDAQPAGPEGSWTGHWVRDGSILEVETTFARTDSGYRGSFSSEQLRVVGIPFTKIRFEAPTLTWDLVGDFDTTTFQGTLRGDTLDGQFAAGKAAGTFRLTRRLVVPPPLAEEEVSFPNGDVRLGGTVIYPAGQGPFPGVVFLHGSGAEGRWASRYLATAFARRGVAALIYDKRGVGASTGDWRAVGFEELVKDAGAAVDLLRSRPRIDPSRVGIHGHSQGGTYAPGVAALNRDVAFVVGSAAAGTPMAETEVYSISNNIGIKTLPAADREAAERYVRALVATAYDGASRSGFEAVWREVRGRPWAFEPPPDTNFYWTFSRRIASFDALAEWRRVTAPALLVYGEADERVPPRRSAELIGAAYRGAPGARLEVLFFPGADHTLRLRPSSPNGFAWPTTAPGYPARVIDWVLEAIRR